MCIRDIDRLSFFAYRYFFPFKNKKTKVWQAEGNKREDIKIVVIGLFKSICYFKNQL